MAKQDAVILSHWYHLIENLNHSSQDFYSSLEGAIKSRQLPHVKTSRVNFPEGGVGSPKREYFRAKRKEYLFDICAAPYGNGFFFSWWLGEKIGFFSRILMSIPIIGAIFFKFAKPMTYYRIDTTLMFQESIRMAVLEVIDGITKAKGIRALSELERKPILSDILKQ